MSVNTFCTVYPSPLGNLLLTSDAGALTGIQMESWREVPASGLDERKFTARDSGRNDTQPARTDGASTRTDTGFARGDTASAEAHAESARTDSALDKVRKQLDEYFAGELEAFDLPLRPAGTDFQRRVWDALLRIPFGETRSYGDIAREIGKPTATRAVGAANGRNPIPVIIPCHRVIAADGTLGGYGGGLERKRILLELEAGAHGQIG